LNENSLALTPVISDVRAALPSYSEDDVKVLREKLEAVFETWKRDNSTTPVTYLFPLRNNHNPPTIEKAFPFKYADLYILDYADLLQHLRESAFPPIGKLDSEFGYQCVSAVLTLSEAEAGRIESALKAHTPIAQYLRDEEAKFREISLIMTKKAIPHVERSVKFKGGTAKKGRVYEPAASITIICKVINSTQFDRVLDFLRDADKCAHLYGSTINPIGVMFEGVDDGSKQIYYTLRGENPDNMKTITFKRLRDILTKIKKNLI
jgi:hypothetical protein